MKKYNQKRYQLFSALIDADNELDSTRTSTILYYLADKLTEQVIFCETGNYNWSISKFNYKNILNNPTFQKLNINEYPNIRATAKAHLKNNDLGCVD